MKGYGIIARPLTELLKKDKFAWSEAATKAYNFLKQAMNSTHVQALPNFSLEFIIEDDASRTGIGVVLMQADHPLAYMSKAFTIKYL